MNTCAIDGCSLAAWARGWCSKHYTRWTRYGDPLAFAPQPTTSDRFWTKVDKDWGAIRRSECWVWTGVRSPGGYGVFRKGPGNVQAHRFAYEERRGVIPDGLQLDHLCRNRACVNPDHLEVVTQAENIRRGEAGINMSRKTHCPQGHPYEGDNLYVSPRGRRECRACRRAAQKRFHGKARITA